MMSGGGLVGLEPGMSLVIGLIALKALESTSRRDFFVLMLLTWFIALCGLFVSQTLFTGAVAASICLVAASAAAVLYSEDQMRWRVAFRRMGLMALQGIPLIALLFLFFPRVQGGFRLTLKGGATGAVGFSEDLDPGEFAKLNENFDSAFRAEFIESEAPGPADRYWRGSVLWDCNGLEWRKGAVYAVEPRLRRPPEGALRHRVTIQPHGARWVFALDRPMFAPKDTTLEPGAYLQATRPINRSTRYEIVSVPGYQDPMLRKEQRAAALRVPKNLPPETKKLAESWKALGNDATILAHGMQWFEAQGFTYSLSPERYQGPRALDDFLFHRRTGFCSHYATAFATLMRLAGVPARVVIGYQGGEYNRHGNYFLVRQNEAHAWAEVWIEGKAWQRVDLTQQLAPSRIESGADRFRDTVDALTGGFRPPAGLADLFSAARMVWDNLNYQWDVRVVAFDEDAQFEFLAYVGLKELPRPLLLLGIFSVASLLLGGAGLWLRRVTRPKRDAAGEAWARTCAQIARISGVAREPWEGPQAYGARAGIVRPDAATAINEAADLYSRIRFGQSPPSLTKLWEATDELSRFAAFKGMAR
jgi:transglutaminase-like putative cysteine protease